MSSSKCKLPKFSARLEESKALYRTDGVNIRLFFFLRFIPPSHDAFLTCLNDHYLMFCQSLTNHPDMISESLIQVAVFLSPCLPSIRYIYISDNFTPRFSYSVHTFTRPAFSLMSGKPSRCIGVVLHCFFLQGIFDFAFMVFWAFKDVCAYRS